jgi:endonuclease/exonuclease/phosphatase family metal-dependent hydrolase
MLQMQGSSPFRMISAVKPMFKTGLISRPGSQSSALVSSKQVDPILMLPLMLAQTGWLGMHSKKRAQPQDNLPSPVQEPGTPPLRVVRPRYKLMSYNAEQFYKTGKGKFVKPMDSIHALARAIQLEDPDVIALQEVGGPELLKEFNIKFLDGKYPNIVSIPFQDSGPMRVAIISKANIRVVDAKSHWQEMSHNAAYPGKRDLLEATFETNTGYRFTVYNAHCHSMRGGEAETAPIRLKEVTNMAKILKAHLQKDPQAQVFVAGDLNTLPDSPYGKPILERLTHVMEDKPEPDLVEVMMKDEKIAPTHNGYGHHPNSKLDYIFVSSPMAKQVVGAYVAGDFDQEPWSIASDHVPYITVFEEPARESIQQKKSVLLQPSAHPPISQPLRERKRLNLIA